MFFARFARSSLASRGAGGGSAGAFVAVDFGGRDVSALFASGLGGSGYDVFCGGVGGGCDQRRGRRACRRRAGARMPELCRKTW